MTLDAMHWVWNHSQSRGNPRIALLAVADQVRNQACEVRMSLADFMRALNVTSKGVARNAVKAAIESGELEVVVPGVGTRPALYRLPKAVGYVRTDTASGPDYRPLEPKKPSRSGPDYRPQGSASGPDSGPQAEDLDHASGPDSDPLRSVIRPSSGPDSDPLYPSQISHEGESDRKDAPPHADGIPDFARPLVDGCTLADVIVRWPFNQTEWFKVHASINKSGIPALVAYARRVYERQRGDIDSARYFLRGWSELPPLPSPDAERPQLRAIPAPAAPTSKTDAYLARAAEMAARFTQAGGA